MISNFIGNLSILSGIIVLFLPLFIPELSRQRDAFLGVGLLVIGLALFASHGILSGSPMLALTGAIIVICKLGLEVLSSRWKALSEVEQVRLSSLERWVTSLRQLGEIISRIFGSLAVFGSLLGIKSISNKKGKQWVRPDLSSEKNAKFNKNADLDSINHNKDLVIPSKEVSLKRKLSDADS